MGCTRDGGLEHDPRRRPSMWLHVTCSITGCHRSLGKEFARSIPHRNRISTPSIRSQTSRYVDGNLGINPYDRCDDGKLQVFRRKWSQQPLRPPLSRSNWYRRKSSLSILWSNPTELESITDDRRTFPLHLLRLHSQTLLRDLPRQSRHRSDSHARRYHLS